MLDYPRWSLYRHDFLPTTKPRSFYNKDTRKEGEKRREGGGRGGREGVMREGRREGGKGEEEWMLSSIDSYLQDKISLTVKGKTDQTLFLKSEEVRIGISNCYLPLHTHNIPHPTHTSITTPTRYTHTSSYYTLTTHTSLCTHLSPHPSTPTRSLPSGLWVSLNGWRPLSG